MPLGDPHGGNFIYTTEGLPTGVVLVTIPVRDVTRSVRFYNGLLGMAVEAQSDDHAVLSCGKDLILIKKSDNAGIETGIYFRTGSPYDLHRRLVDEGVVFVTDPKRTALGLITSFKDDDGNVINALEIR